MPLQTQVHLYLQPQPKRGKCTGLYISIQRQASLGAQAGADQGQPDPSVPALGSCCWGRHWQSHSGATWPGAAEIAKSNQACKPSWHTSVLFSFREMKSNSFPSSLLSAVFNTMPFYFYNLSWSQSLTSLNFQEPE